MVSQNARDSSAATSAEETRTGTLKGLQVLVVDDYPDITSLVGEVLADQGASIVPANSGMAAIGLIALMRFDLVVLDLGMPQPDGKKIIEFLRTNEPGLLRRTLVLTGLKYDRAAIDLLEDQGIPCLLKPFQIEDLVDAASRMSPPGPGARPGA